jgi:hypothetical protein
MSAIQEVVSKNYLFEDQTALDPFWRKGKDLSNFVSDSQVFFVVAIAEIVNGVAQGALLWIGLQDLNSEQFIFILKLSAFLKLIWPKGYEKADIEKFKQRKTYVEYFKGKAEIVACLSAKQQALWLLNECFSKTWRKGACVVFISLTRHNLAVFARNPLLQPTLMSVIMFISYRVLLSLFKDILDFAEAHLHVFTYDLVSKN